MSQREKKDVDTEVLGALELHPPRVRIPVMGNCDVAGQGGPAIVNCRVIGMPLKVAEARRTWNGLPDGLKQNPQTVARAVAYNHLAVMAYVDPPNGIKRLLPTNPNDAAYFEPTGVILSPGSRLFEGKKIVPRRCICFIFNNMDEGFYVVYAEMTGREQCEWTLAWERCNRSLCRNEKETNGLRGTDLRRIANREELRKCLVRSPTLVKCRRPDNSPIADADWTAEVDAARGVRRRGRR